MATLKYLSQYFTTSLNVGGGINDSQTTGIVLLDVSGVSDTSKPGQICISYSDPIDTSVAEWIDYTSINGSKELVGVTRGREGYSAHSHLQSATVAFVLSASHHNDIVDQLNGTATGAVLKAPLLTHESSVSTPASGKLAIYAKSDDKVYKKNSAGTETEFGASIITTTQYAPQGFLINGKIVPSVSSNNLTVAIKGMDGNDPSSSNPVYIRIGDTVRTLTAALSVTKNAGTNWCNSGGAELATKEIDYFVYLGYNATDGTVVGFSRIPYANRYDDFSATTTNEKYCAISTITTAAAGDYYQNIGRFAATLSAGAGYTWTVPTFTATNLIQRPIYETRTLNNATTWAGFSADPSGTFKYKLVSNLVYLEYSDASAGSSNATTMTFTTPFAPLSTKASFFVLHVKDNGTNQSVMGHLQCTAGSSTISVWKTFYQGAFTSSGAKDMYVGELIYQI